MPLSGTEICLSDSCQGSLASTNSTGRAFTVPAIKHAGRAEPLSYTATAGLSCSNVFSSTKKKRALCSRLFVPVFAKMLMLWMEKETQPTNPLIHFRGKSALYRHWIVFEQMGQHPNPDPSETNGKPNLANPGQKLIFVFGSRRFLG